MREIQVRQITDPADPAIAAFGRLQDRAFPEPELLIPPSIFPRMLATRTAERRNLMIVAEAGAEVVGGALFHYFPGVNTGFSSFLAVAPEVRGQGVARRLHEARFAALDREAAEQAPVHGVFIDVVAPERLSEAERERERAVGSDPVARRRIFHALGFRKVDVAYYQPDNHEPITNMDLLYCPRHPAERIPTELVAATMHAYWRPWLGAAVAAREADLLRRRCGGETVALLPAY